MCLVCRVFNVSCLLGCDHLEWVDTNSFVHKWMSYRWAGVFQLRRGEVTDWPANLLHISYSLLFSSHLWSPWVHVLLRLSVTNLLGHADPLTLLVLTQRTQNNCITFIQCWSNVEDVGPTLYKCYTNVLCLLGMVWFNWFEVVSLQINKQIPLRSLVTYYHIVLYLFFGKAHFIWNIIFNNIFEKRYWLANTRTLSSRGLWCQ